MGDENQLRHRAHIPNPQPYDESAKDLRYLKKWFNRHNNYTKQNDEYLVFFEGGEFENWTSKREYQTSGLLVQLRAAAQSPPLVEEIIVEEAAKKTRSLRCYLEALLLIFADYYVPIGYTTWSWSKQQVSSLSST